MSSAGSDLVVPSSPTRPTRIETAARRTLENTTPSPSATSCSVSRRVRIDVAYPARHGNQRTDTNISRARA